MASISKKPSTLPLSISTSTTPVLPVFSSSGVDLSKVQKKKKSFGAFDKIRNAFSSSKPHRHSESEDIPKSGIPIIVTPTEEKTKTFANAKAFHSADNIFSSNELEVKTSSPTLLIPSVIPKATSNENLVQKEKKVEKVLRSTECLITKTKSEITEEHDLTKLSVKKCDSTDEYFFKRRWSLSIRLNETNEGNESQFSPVEVELNDVKRNQANLEQSAAMHKKTIKPKGRRPPTVYQQFVSQNPPDSSGNAAPPAEKLSPRHQIVEAKQTELNKIATQKENVKVEEKAEDSSDNTPKLSVPAAVRRDKTFVPKLDELQQKVRRRTVANFQSNEAPSTELAKQNGETTGASELKVFPVHAYRNASFKFTKKESEVKTTNSISESHKPESNHPLPTKILPTQTMEAVGNTGEKNMESDLFVSRKSKLIRERINNIVSKDNTKVGPNDQARPFVPCKTDVAEKEIIKRPQSKFLPQGPVLTHPANNTKLLRTIENPDIGDQGNKHYSDSGTKSTDTTANDDKFADPLLPNVTDKFAFFKKWDGKNASNDQLEQISEPGFKLLLKPEAGKAHPTNEMTASADNLAPDNNLAKEEVDRVLPLKSEERSNDSELFESARLKFGSKSFKAHPPKVTDDVAANEKVIQSKTPPAGTNPQSSKLVSQNTNLYASPSLSFANRKDIRPVSSMQIKDIPPEPFKTSPLNETKVGGTAPANDPQSNLSKVIPTSRARLNLKDVKPSTETFQSGQEEGLTQQTSKPSAKISPSVPSKDFIISAKITVDEPSSVASKLELNSKPSCMRAASGVNTKAIPNKLNFNPNDWMAERREKSEKLS